MSKRQKDSRQEKSVFLTRQSVKKKRDWKKRVSQLERTLLSIAIVLAGFAALYLLYNVVFLGDTFTVKKMMVDGKMKYLTANFLGELSGVKEGDNLFWVNVVDVHKRLKTEPWVKFAAARRKLPDTLWIYVEEYTPKAIVAASDGLYYLDENAEMFKKVDANDDKNFPVLTGVDIKKGGEDEDNDTARISEMLSLIDMFRASNFGAERDVAEINFDPVAGYSIFPKKDTMQILLGEKFISDRLADLDRMHKEIAKHTGRVKYMLVTEPGRVVVKYYNGV